MTDWHLTDDVAAALAADPTRINHATAASAEQHLVACPRCQEAVARHSRARSMDEMWAEIVDEIDQPVGRQARWVSETTWTRLVAATPALRLGALVAGVAVIALVVIVSRLADTPDVFLVLAPIVPTVGVAIIFAPGAEPAGECGLATPMHGIGLLVRRVAVVEISALVVLGSSAVLIDGPMVVAVGWLLPSLALSVGTIAGASRWPATSVAGALSVGWVAAVLTATWLGRASSVSESVAFGAVGQGVIGALVVFGVAVTAIRRQVLYMEVLQ